MEKLTAIIMLEILGKPAEHIKKVLTELVSKIEQEKDVKVTRKNIAEPKKLETKNIQGEVFTSFAEIELETNIQMFMRIIFTYSPSHIEIITPEELKIRNVDLNSFFTDLLIRLHQYDELAKALMIERQMLANQIQEGKIKIASKEEVEKLMGKNDKKVKGVKKSKMRKKIKS